MSRTETFTVLLENLDFDFFFLNLKKSRDLFLNILLTYLLMLYVSMIKKIPMKLQKETPCRCFKRFALDRTGCFMNQCHLLREIFF